MVPTVRSDAVADDIRADARPDAATDSATYRLARTVASADDRADVTSDASTNDAEPDSIADRGSSNHRCCDVRWHLGERRDQRFVNICGGDRVGRGCRFQRN